METLTKKELIFKKYYDRLRVELHNAYWHFVIYKQLDKARREYPNELMQAPEFFSFSERSHILDAIIRVNRICANDRYSLNIIKLLNYAKTNQEIFSDKSYQKRKATWGTFTTSTTPNRPRIDNNFIDHQVKRFSMFRKSNLKKMRDRVLAHINRDDVKNNVLPFKEYYVEVEELEAIINEIDNTLNILGIAFDGSRYDKEFPQITEGMKNMLECIRRGLQRSDNN
jgi:hypothetical protein